MAEREAVRLELYCNHGRHRSPAVAAFLNQTLQEAAAADDQNEMADNESEAAAADNVESPNMADVESQSTLEWGADAEVD